MKKFSDLLLIVVLMGLMAGCGASVEEIAGTVESEVAMQVQATIESLPSLTPVNTSTPLATATPQATYTPYPTFTPIPTFTPLPTYTPFPTLEPTPEDTPTAVPTDTPVPVIQPTALPPTEVPTSNLETMKTVLANMLSDLDSYQYMISITKKGNGLRFPGYRPIKCRENVDLRDRVISTVTLDVSNDIPEIKNAYAVYLDVAQQFAVLTNAWNEGCLASIAEGDSEKEMGDAQRAEIKADIEKLKGLLNDVNNTLFTLEE